MRSNAKDVETYLKEVEVDRRESLTQLRKLCLEILDGYEESMEVKDLLELLVDLL